MGGLQEVLLVLGVFRRGGPLGTRDPLSDDGYGVRTEAELPQPGVAQALGGAGPVPGDGRGRRVSIIQAQTPGRQPSLTLAL